MGLNVPTTLWRVFMAFRTITYLLYCPVSTYQSVLIWISGWVGPVFNTSLQAVFLTGVQLLTVDEKIPGPTRERLLVSYYRYSGQAGHNSHVDTVCELLRRAS